MADADFDALEKALNDCFLKKFAPEGTGNEQAILTFEWCPVPLSPENFMKIAGDVSTFSQTEVNEEFSGLVNQRVIRSGNYRLPSSDKLSDTYFYELLGSSQFYSDPNASETVNEERFDWFDSVKAEAKKRYDRYQFVVNEGVADKYCASFATPENWLHPQANSLWNSFEVKIEAPSNGNDKEHNKSLKELQWRKIDDKLFPNEISKSFTSLLDMETTSKPQQSGNFGIVGRAIATNKAVTMVQPISAKKPNDNPRSALPALKMLENQPFISKVMASATRAKGFSDINSLLNVDRTALVSHSGVPISPAILSALKRHAVEILAPAIVETGPVSTDRITIKFQYQIVRVERRWMFSPFLYNRHWYVPGVRKGEYSSVSYEDDGQRFRLMPTALVLIRNLSVLGNWSDQDKAKIKDAVAIGPFGISKQEMIKSGEISCPGIQLIACINEYMPELPPCSDPKLN